MCCRQTNSWGYGQVARWSMSLDWDLHVLLLRG